MGVIWVYKEYLCFLLKVMVIRFRFVAYRKVVNSGASYWCFFGLLSCSVDRCRQLIAISDRTLRSLFMSIAFMMFSFSFRHKLHGPWRVLQMFDLFKIFHFIVGVRFFCLSFQ